MQRAQLSTVTVPAAGRWWSVESSVVMLVGSNLVCVRGPVQWAERRRGEGPEEPVQLRPRTEEDASTL